MLLPTGKLKSGVGRFNVAFWHIHGTNEKVDLDAQKQFYSVKYCLIKPLKPDSYMYRLNQSVSFV